MDSTTPSQPRRTPGARGACGVDLTPVRKDHAARAAARAWRSLTNGSPTLLACSGGADSTALVLALVAASGGVAPFVIGHVVHDLRSASEALADRDAARDLAAALGVAFDERAVRVPTTGNAEAHARRLRYGALVEMARAHACGFVAAAHHAEDQLETMLLAMTRGAGPRGLSGMRPRRRLAEGVTLVRPMLGLTRTDADRICVEAGIAWRVDATNADLSRARAAVRHTVLPTLERLRPGAAGRAANAALLLQDAAALVDARVLEVFADRFEWPRDALRIETALVVGEGLRRTFSRLTGGAARDRLARRVVDPAVAFIRSRSGERRVFEWPRGVRVEVERDAVRVSGPC